MCASVTTIEREGPGDHRNLADGAALVPDKEREPDHA